MKTRISNAHSERQGSLWMAGWHLAARIGNTIYHTDGDGYGLWTYTVGSGEDHQIVGTCQLHARTFRWFSRYLHRNGYAADGAAADGAAADGAAADGAALGGDDE